MNTLTSTQTDTQIACDHHWNKYGRNKHGAQLYRCVRCHVMNQSKYLLHPNRYEIRDGHAVIIMCTKNGTIVEALIDIGDVERVRAHHWHPFYSKNTKSYYVQSNSFKKTHRTKALLLHRFIANAPSWAHIDHRNRNTLDNQQENLRSATPLQNVLNREKMRVAERDGFWIARLSLRGRDYHLGQYATKNDAEMACFGARVLADHLEADEHGTGRLQIDSEQQEGQAPSPIALLEGR